MKKNLLSQPLCFLCLFALTACGTSLYRPLAGKETPAALREETLVQLNSGNYDAALQSAEKLWDKEKTNSSASLYAITLSSIAGVGLFDLTINSIKAVSSQSSQSSSSSGNSVFNSLSTLLPSFTTTQLASLKKSIEILDSAPNKTASDLLFQRCLTAGIYTIPTIKNLQTSLTAVQTTLTELPTKLGSGSGTGCSASTATINTAASELSSSIGSLTTIAEDFASAMSIISDCFPSSEGKDTLNSVSQQVSKLKQNADKGCAIPNTQKIGSYTLPSCLNDTITALGGNSALANDGEIAGCELFLNCSSGSCL